MVVLDYDPDAETLKMAESHSHPAEIWQLASCPAGDPRALLSVYCEGASLSSSDATPVILLGRRIAELQSAN